MIQSAWNTLCLLAPWLLLGALLAGILHVLLPGHWLRRRLSGPAGVFQAVLLGVPLPLCSCGVIPTGIGLRRSGASDQAAVAFLISTPQTGVDSILVSGSFLGWPFALFKVVVACVTGIIGGLLSVDTRNDSSPAESEPGSSNDDASRSLRELVPHGIEMIRTIWLWLVAGVLISAALETWIVPTRYFQSISQAGPGISMVLMLVISLPMYVCATASVPIAATLVAGGMPTGAAMVFLLAGPATNVATIGAVYSQFGRRNLAVYVSTLVIGSMLGGLAFDWIIGTSSAREAVHVHDQPGWFSRACGVLLLGLFAWFAWQDLVRRRTHRQLAAGSLTLHVSGMHCGGCVRNIEAALDRLPGVEDFRVDLDSGLVVVAGPVDADTVRTRIRSAGYQIDE